MTNHEHKKTIKHEHNEHHGHSHDHEHDCKHEHKHDHNCKHEHHHEHSQDCKHEHGHKHNQNCKHEHHKSTENKYQRHNYNDSEVLAFQTITIEKLLVLTNEYIEEEIYGKAVPLLEIILKKLAKEASGKNENKNLISEIKHHLALSYGIIGEYDNSISLWEETIHNLNTEKETETALEVFYNALLSARLADNNQKFMGFLAEGIKIAETHNLKKWSACFIKEHGIYNMELGEFNAAEEKFNAAINQQKEVSDAEGLISSYYYLGNVYEEQKKYEKSKNTYENALIILKKSQKSNEYSEYKSLIEERLASAKSAILKQKLTKF